MQSPSCCSCALPGSRPDNSVCLQRGQLSPDSSSTAGEDGLLGRLDAPQVVLTLQLVLREGPLLGRRRVLAVVAVAALLLGVMALGHGGAGSLELAPRVDAAKGEGLAVGLEAELVARKPAAEDVEGAAAAAVAALPAPTDEGEKRGKGQ